MGLPKQPSDCGQGSTAGGGRAQGITFGLEALASGAMIATGQSIRQSRLVWLFLRDGEVRFREEAEMPRAERPLPFSATVR